ncbi:MAG: phospholipase D family protein [Gammaproteobacteria bacterium]|nr:MAG: phospholipase D family protein [Gammaproteobacteria bacterium]
MKTPLNIIAFCCRLNRTVMAALVTLALSACVSMPPNDHQISSTVLTDTDDTTMGRSVTEAVASNGGKTGVLLLNTGLGAFVARAVLAINAERSLDVQYYLLHRDLSGRLLLDQLLKAADRGVRVRLLVDDMDMAAVDLGIAVMDAHPNMEVRLFNPFARNRTRLVQYVSRFGSVTRRMHNKSFTADNQLSIIGGRNVGDEYFEAGAESGFADMDVLLAGPAVKEVSKSFDLYWNSALSYTANSLGEPVPSDATKTEAWESLQKWVTSKESSAYIQALRTSDLGRAIKSKEVEYHWADVEIFYDHPDKISADRDQTHLHMSRHLSPYFDDAKSEVFIISPYFVPGKRGTQKLCGLSEKGVDVRVLTNSLASTDVAVVHAGYLRYRKKLLKCGVRLYEANSKLVMRDANLSGYNVENRRRKKKLGMSRSSLHAKMFLFDRRFTFVGSLNLDPRSITENTEIGAVIDSRVIGEELAQAMLNKVPKIAFTVTLDENGKIRWDGYENGEPVTYTREPHTGFFKRAGTQFMRILPIESQI